MADAGLAILLGLEDIPESRLQAWHDALPASSRARAVSFRSRTRFRQFVAARRALLGLLAVQGRRESLLVEAGEGPPRFEDGPAIYCSLSHSSQAVMVAWSKLAPIGVDIEQHRPRNLIRLVDQWFHADERRAFRKLPTGERELWFYRRWTRKEASAKAVGCGLTRALLAVPDDEPSHYVATFPLSGYTASVVHHHQVMPIFYQADFDSAAFL